MCGICGIFGRVDNALAARMLDAIRHRGPDSFNVVDTANASIAGCRLTIVGNGTTALPFFDAETGSHVLLNGEIYNYRQLAKDLDLQLERVGDPEALVVSRVVQHFGLAGVAKLQGMFAFAILSGERLVLARDRLGIKPMFFAHVGKELAFGSEIKAILRHPGCRVELDPEALDEIAVLGYLASDGRTPFAGIRQVSPGTVVHFEGGYEREERYWQAPKAFFSSPGEGLCMDDAAQRLLDVLRSSVRTILGHDQRSKAFYLSGGVDSSLLAVLATEVLPRVRTFTLADADDSPDLLAARRVARAIGAEHHELRVNLQDYLAELPAFVRHYESLVAGGVFDVHGGIAFHILSRHIAREAQVACSGEGADELFGGYYWTYTHSLGFADRIKTLLARLGRPEPVAALVESLFPLPEDAATYRRNLFDFLLQGGLANYHLWSVDRSCGAFGFEVRPPYLHDDVVKQALSLPMDLKVHGRGTKMVLKAAALPLFAEFGIGECLTRQKEGMPAAVRSIAVELGNLARELVPVLHLESHPFGRYISSPIDCMMVDLFCNIFLANRGDLPAGFDVIEFYRSGAYADMYR